MTAIHEIVGDEGGLLQPEATGNSTWGGKEGQPRKLRGSSPPSPPHATAICSPPPCSLQGTQMLHRDPRSTPFRTQQSEAATFPFQGLNPSLSDADASVPGLVLGEEREDPPPPPLSAEP